MQGVIVFIGIVAYIGGITFPLGFFALFVWSTAVFNADGTGIAMCVTGWLAYLSLIIVGMVRKSKVLFIILLAVLLANIAGCQLPHLTSAFSMGD